jgi:hypothetical protein
MVQKSAVKGKGTQSKRKSKSRAKTASSTQATSHSASGSKRSRQPSDSEDLERNLSQEETDGNETDEPPIKKAKQAKPSAAQRSRNDSESEDANGLGLSPEQLRLWKALNKKVQAAKADAEPQREAGRWQTLLASNFLSCLFSHSGEGQAHDAGRVRRTFRGRGCCSRQL